MMFYHRKDFPFFSERQIYYVHCKTNNCRLLIVDTYDIDDVVVFSQPNYYPDVVALFAASVKVFNVGGGDILDTGTNNFHFKVSYSSAIFPNLLKIIPTILTIEWSINSVLSQIRHSKKKI